ncbi:hypothetical protein AC231_14275 [Clostridium pasteurianum]|uniref:hypothetical protein n=1 Tax=Clostridium pasteurianum TaxID=1501 RepID=UPI0002A75E58|nr:hypothetical protein [Clostridium pasteurianum]AOZ74171.1 hypothetical protein AQ983_03255 [Clostridium pasteurianum DSM 525 = ATCC 6013]AOZ77969.1 hypothetical protein AQ984_03255 [Clostridium pasteurianum]ELP58612.1 hypothetical protein F502_14070 [Clostridium pasteurianum DSM 525 = ATCC 6013]OMH21605.1 hypothetical protein AC231_14275 [Clostridium pasteurianum]
MGKGCNYEKRIEKHSDSSLYYYSTPFLYTLFTESSTAGVFTTSSLGRNKGVKLVDKVSDSGKIAKGASNSELIEDARKFWKNI